MRNIYNVIYFSLFIIPSSLLSSDEHEKVFTEIYNNAVWGRNEKGEGFSGGGSLLKNTMLYIEYLENFIQENDIKTIIDVGCGDWEFSKYINWHGVDYIGYDIVLHIIEKNKIYYANDHINFIHANFIIEDLPPADLLLCKHVLQHLPNKDIITFLKQISKFKYCLITNEVYPNTLSSDGSDIDIGGGHKIDLACAPFNMKGEKVMNYKIGNSVHQVFLINNSIKEK